ncbi:redoxin domain-containing protein [Echinicola marina]|uniref:redoxin domain-containing protein n=1 Tax=Echinicola marina TaxID=2859768 RepID=UPI001CF63EAD|nr:redoxin domain-containing protein [Echinicola marina]UCS93560.1 redoxin domain-containing protein [Echinicola marina]
MKSVLILIIAFIAAFSPIQAQQLEMLELEDLALSTIFKMKDHQKDKALVLIFTSNACPYAKLYEDRIIQLQKQFNDKGITFAMVNPHAGQSEEENFDQIHTKINQKNITFSYLSDPNQSLNKALDATKIPEVFVLIPSPTGFGVAYHGAIDNNPQAPNSVTKKHLENALNQILKKENPVPNFVRAIGCNIKIQN